MAMLVITRWYITLYVHPNFLAVYPSISHMFPSAMLKYHIPGSEPLKPYPRHMSWYPYDIHILRYSVAFECHEVPLPPGKQTVRYW